MCLLGAFGNHLQAAFRPSGASRSLSGPSWADLRLSVGPCWGHVGAIYVRRCTSTGQLRLPLDFHDDRHGGMRTAIDTVGPSAYHLHLHTGCWCLMSPAGPAPRMRVCTLQLHARHFVRVHMCVSWSLRVHGLSHGPRLGPGSRARTSTWPRVWLMHLFPKGSLQVLSGVGPAAAMAAEHMN